MRLSRPGVQEQQFGSWPRPQRACWASISRHFLARQARPDRRAADPRHAPEMLAAATCVALAERSTTSARWQTMCRIRLLHRPL